MTPSEMNLAMGEIEKEANGEPFTVDIVFTCGTSQIKNVEISPVSPHSTLIQLHNPVRYMSIDNIMMIGRHV